MTLHPYWYHDTAPANDYWVTKQGIKIGKSYPSRSAAIDAMHRLASEDEERESRPPFSMSKS